MKVKRMNYEEFLKKLRDTRIAKNVSYKEIGGAIGVTPQTIYAMEKIKKQARGLPFACFFFVIYRLLQRRSDTDTLRKSGEGLQICAKHAVLPENELETHTPLSTQFTANAEIRAVQGVRG